MDGMSAPVRCILPLDWPDEGRGTRRLVRRFGRPRTSRSGCEIFELQLLAVAGLVAVRLNGDELTLLAENSPEYRLRIDRPLLDRNILELDVDLDRVDRSRLAGRWGEVALVIRTESADLP